MIIIMKIPDNIGSLNRTFYAVRTLSANMVIIIIIVVITIFTVTILIMTMIVIVMIILIVDMLTITIVGIRCYFDAKTCMSLLVYIVALSVAVPE